MSSHLETNKATAKKERPCQWPCYQFKCDSILVGYPHSSDSTVYFEIGVVFLSENRNSIV